MVISLPNLNITDVRTEQEKNTVYALFKKDVIVGTITYRGFLKVFSAAHNIKPTVIMVSGFKGAGKDFISEKLSKSIFNPKSFSNPKIFSFAEPIKDILATTLDTDVKSLNYMKDSDLDIYLEREYMTNMRRVLQRFGTDAMKKWFGEDVWVNVMKQNLNPDEMVIISDWRFQHEYDSMCEVANVITLRVDNHEAKGDGHISENDLFGFDFDFRIDNTRKDSSYISQINAFLEKIDSDYGFYVKKL
ncbi:deoxynucleoside monophosphate kinase [Thiohalocapsa phage LS06-2018-MD03]|nr:deoxynucleoside monophosphate kinase [Thiohalocapsa phage LS06-2018-MD03]